MQQDAVHSQQYLSLRARQGKLKAVKFGRNWVTKKEWVEEYADAARLYNSKMIFTQMDAPKEIKAVPPKNLPIEQSKLLEGLKLSATISLVCILLGSSISYSRSSFKTVSDSLDPYADKIYSFTKSLAREGEETIGDVRIAIASYGDKFSDVYYQTGSAAEIFKEYGNWLVDNLKGDNKDI